MHKDHWKGTYISAIDPSRGEAKFSFTKYYIDQDHFGLTDVVSSINNEIGLRSKGDDGGGNNDIAESLYEDLYNNTVTMAFSTPKAFYGIHENDFSPTFNITKKEFERFVDGWVVGFKSAAADRIKDINEGNEDNTSSKSAINDPDIKLNLYKSFKSIFDKWISRSSDSGGGDYKMFYNKVINNKQETRSLVDHFNYIDRGFNDIGNKSVIDITQLGSIADNPTQSLYQLVTELLSKNNFDFHPLPGFINYGEYNGEDGKQSTDPTSPNFLGKMFEPVTSLESIDSSPSFVCMYVGGTSKSLDIGSASQAFCGADNQIVYEYEDDGLDLREPDGAFGSNGVNDPKDGSKVTAFLVEYGIENQSHFKTVSLDQAEFKETQESLMVIDQLAKGGDENNRAAKGQNLYNVYQTRSYTCTVEALGNMQIQPFMYFQLTNVPMFHGAYLITEVKHSVQPHNMTTTFKGTRVPKVVIPIVTDAYSVMALGQTDTNKSGSNGSARDYIDNQGNGGGGDAFVAGGGTSNEVYPTSPDEVNDLGFGPVYPSGIQTHVNSRVGPRNAQAGASKNHEGLDIAPKDEAKGTFLAPSPTLDDVWSTTADLKSYNKDGKGRPQVNVPVLCGGDGEVYGLAVRPGVGIYVSVIHDKKTKDGKGYVTRYLHLLDVNKDIVTAAGAKAGFTYQQWLDGDVSGKLTVNNLGYKIKKGQVIGLSGGQRKLRELGGSDSSGPASSGPHLHLELFEFDADNFTADKQSKIKSCGACNRSNYSGQGVQLQVKDYLSFLAEGSGNESYNSNQGGQS
jgi:hypothetical protein